MDKLTRLSSEDRDNLTAYLDGELDENATRRIESILTNSTVARNDVEMLARTYEMLDLLPQAKAPNDFTEKTVATAKLESYRRPLTQQPWFRKLQRGALLGLWSLALVVTAMAGYSLTQRWIPQEQDLLLDDLPVIERLDVYTEIRDLEFLRALSSQPQLQEEIQGAAHP